MFDNISYRDFYCKSVYQSKKAKKEIKKVQKKTNVPDKTNKLNSKLKQSVSEIRKETANQNPVKKLETFTNAVKTGSKYDLKSQANWQETISYNGFVMDPQDIGNFHFGYLGRSMGYSIEFMTMGAGVYQFMGDTRYIPWCFTSFYCDDPRDNYYIRLGAIAYDNEN